MPPNPVLVETTRGDAVESRHRGAIAIAESDGTLRHAVGDVGRPVFPRSAVKALQALPLIESGAADALGLSNAEIALACSSHNGEPMHVEAARSMLAKAGLSEAALECGPQWPAREEDWAALVRAGKDPAPIHNNCSGKHAGMIATGQHRGIPVKGYVGREHPVQAGVRRAMEDMTGASLDEAPCGIDGCSIPTYAVPLDALARAFARFGTGTGLPKRRADAVARLHTACFSRPDMVAGTGRYCTRIMAAMKGLVFVKTGAEGVFCASFPTLGLGVALKVDDGATRAAEAIMSAVILHLLGGDLHEVRRTTVSAAGFPPVTDRWGTVAGAVRFCGEI